MDEKALLKALGKLDRDALASAFEHYAPMLFKYVMRLCHDPQEADDVVGEVFSRLLDRLTARKGPRENLRAYLYQTAYHIIVDNSRDRRHYDALDGYWNQSKGEYLTPQQADEHHQLELIQAAINSNLTGDQKHVVVLRFLEGFDLNETASILGMDVNNVKVTQHRAVARLRDALSKEM